MEPLSTTKVADWWMVGGARLSYKVVLDPMAGGVIVFGAFPRQDDLTAVLKRIGPRQKHGHKYVPVHAYDPNSSAHIGKFLGFLPDEAAAVAVARPMYRSYFGADVLESLEPLFATKVDGWWLIGGKAAALHKPGLDQDFSIDEVHLFLDPFSGRIAGGAMNPDQIRDIMKESIRDRDGKNVY